MSQERLENGALSSLSSTITDVATTVAVADATMFSASPQFRIIIDSEIMLVTGISGNNLTVARSHEGTTGAAHNSGAIVAQIITRDGIKRYMQDWNNPLFDVNTGRPQQLLDSTDVTLTTSDFAWTNQGSASDAALPSGGILFTVDTQGTDSARLYLRTLTAPWTVTCAISHLWLGGTTPGAGMCIVDNSASTFKTWGPEGLSSIRRDRWTNTTTFASNQQDFTSFGSRSKLWLQIEDDNVDHFFRISIDGVNFVTVAQETRTTHTATPDRVGVFLNNDNTGQNMLVDLHSWIEE